MLMVSIMFGFNSTFTDLLDVSSKATYSAIGFALLSLRESNF